MVKEILLDSHIEAGKILLQELDRCEFHITTAMWFFYPDMNDWKLLLFSPDFEKQEKTPQTLYREISKAISNLGDKSSAISLDSIRPVFKNDSLLKMFQVIIHINGISTVRMKSNYINGIYIEDALIYRNLPT